MRLDPITTAGLIIALGSGAASQLNPQQSTIQHTATATQSSNATISIENEAVKALSEQAEQRYLSGLCFVALNPIAPGQVVQETVAPGSFACDRFGSTAVIAVNGELVNIARTGNQSIIFEGIK